MTSHGCKTSIANIFKEDFEGKALAQAIHKPLCWFRYLDAMLVIWPHRPQTLQKILDHLNSIHRNIQFTMETEGWPPSFSDITIGDQMAPWAIRSTKNVPTQTSTWTLNHITILRKNKPFLQPSCTGPGLCLTRKVSMMSWNSYTTFRICPQPKSENFQAQTYAHLSCSPAICPDDIQPP